MNHRERVRTALKVSAFAAVLLGLVACRAFGPAEGGSSKAVADAILASGSTAIKEIEYKDANILDPAEIKVFLKSGTNDEQADAFWCSVVPPIANATTGADAISVWDSDGGHRLGSGNPQCP